MAGSSSRNPRPGGPGQAEHDRFGPTTLLSGVGAARARALERMGIASVRDLLFLLPAGLVEWGPAVPAASVAQRVGQAVRVAGRIVETRKTRLGGRRSILRATIEDASGRAQAVWFNQPWIAEELGTGEPIELFGRVAAGRGGATLQVPRVGRADRPLPPPGSLTPEYPAGEGVSAETLGRLCREALERFGARVAEPLPDAVLAELDLPALPSAVAQAHRPASRAAFEAARRRLALEPLLAVQARLFERRARRGSAAGGAPAVAIDDARDAELRARFPFAFTPGQRAVVAELRRDLARRVPMRRLLQGEVGSGKTVLGLYAAMAVVEGGGQAAFMAPTELLAEQHHYGASPVLAAAGVRAALLTGSVARDERRSLLERLARGELDVVFGTHALFSEDVRFARLDLAVIDEQHRFGVGQRAALAGKGRGAHLLLMTATPIPRTLALSSYGDLEVATLRDLPPGRGALATRWVRDKRELKRVSDFIAGRLALGEQVYWVCPRIGGDETKASRAAAAERRYEQALASRLADFGVELVHGRVPSEERAFRLDRFRRGEIGLLVATTVIEVGVDVPSATVMVIENAERLGLAQLHQLRGRVGRGPGEAWCFLLGDPKSAPRFLELERTRDGFELAELDLAQRGMGDLGGARQSGTNLEGLSDPERDLDLVQAARDLMRARPDLRRAYLCRAGPDELAP